MQCFKVYSNEIKGRLDASYALASMQGSIKSIYPLKTIKNICLSSVSGGTPSKSISEFWNGTIPWASPKDIKEHFIYDTEDHITEEAIKKSSTKLIPKNSLIIVFRGLQSSFNTSINKVAIAINQDLKAITFADNISPEYVSYFFRVFQKQVFPLITKQGTTVQSINTEQFIELEIPIPPTKIQNKIVEIMQSAYESKKQKEQEAGKLLNSVDDFIFEQLGITLPEVTDRMCFVVRVDELENRLDPLFYSQEILNFIKHSTHKSLTIAEATEYLKSGFAAGKSEQSETNSGIIQIRPTNLSDDRQLIFDKNVYIKEEDREERKSYLLKKGEVLFNNTNSQELVGKTVLFNMDGDYFCSNHITRIKTKENLVNPNYLTLMLNLYQRNKVFFNTCTNWNNQSGVNVELLSSFTIPVPDIDVQVKIAEATEQRIATAKRLQKEAQDGLKQAKEQVERIILGEEKIE